MHVRIDPATYWTWPSGKRGGRWGGSHEMIPIEVKERER